MHITKGKVFKPFAIMLGGVVGAGKTTWAVNSPKPLFIRGDEVNEFDVDRLDPVKTWDDFKNQLKWILATKPNYETIVIDTIDFMEKMLHQKIVDDDDKSKGSMNKAMGGYGNGYSFAEKEMIDVRENLLKPIRDDLGKNIIIIVHSKPVTVTDPLQTMSYNSNDMCLHAKSISVWSDWVSGIFFADFVTYKIDGDNTSKTFLTGRGERVLYTEKRPSHFGKNRWGLPYELPLEFNEFYTRFKEFYDAGEVLDPATLARTITSLSENITDADLKDKVLKAVVAASSDTKKLNRILMRARELTT